MNNSYVKGNFERVKMTNCRALEVHPLMNSMTAAAHSSVVKIEANLVEKDLGRCFPVFRKTIQFIQSLVIKKKKRVNNEKLKNLQR